MTDTISATSQARITRETYDNAGRMLRLHANNEHWTNDQFGAARLLLRKYVYGLTSGETNVLYGRPNPQETIESIRPITQELFARSYWQHRREIETLQVSMTGAQSKWFEDHIDRFHAAELTSRRVLVTTHS